MFGKYIIYTIKCNTSTQVVNNNNSPNYYNLITKYQRLFRIYLHIFYLTKNFFFFILNSLYAHAALSGNTNCKLSYIEGNNKLSLENYIFKVNSLNFIVKVLVKSFSYTYSN